MAGEFEGKRVSGFGPVARCLTIYRENNMLLVVEAD